MTVTAFFFPTVTTGSNVKWITPNNCLLDDEASTTAVCSRTLRYPTDYTTSGTGSLTPRTFTGIMAGISNGDLIDGIEIVVRAKQSRTNVDVDMTVQVHSQTVTQRLTNEFVEYTFGGATTPWTTDAYYKSGVTFAAVGFPSISASMTSGNGESTVTIEFVKMRIYWSDTHCDTLTFNTVASQPLGEWIYSNAVTIAGMPGGYASHCFIVGRPHQYYTNSSIPLLNRHAMECEINNSGLWYSGFVGTVVNGDTIRIRRKELYAYVTDPYATLHYVNIGGLPFYWTIGTIAVDNTIPTALTSRAFSGLPRSSLVKVFTYHIADINTYEAGSYVFANSTYTWFPLDGGAVSALQITPTVLSPNRITLTVLGPYDSTFTREVFVGDYLEFWVNTPATYNTTITSTLYIGPTFGSPTFITVAETLTPTQAYWASPAAVNTSTVTTTAAAITIAGLDATTTAAVTFSTSGGSVHEFKKNAGAWTAVGGGSTAANGDTFSVRMTSPGAGSQSGNITMKVNGAAGMHASFTIVTTGGDVTPDALAFVDQTGIVPGLLSTSAAVVLAGVTAAQPILATVSPGFDIRVGAGAWTAGSLSVANGDSITLRGYAPLQAGTTKSCVVTIGGTQDTWTLTSRAASAFWD